MVLNRRKIDLRLYTRKLCFFFFLNNEDSETLAQVAHKAISILAKIQGQVWWTSEQPDIVYLFPAHCRHIGLDGLYGSLPTQTTPWLYEACFRLTSSYISISLFRFNCLVRYIHFFHIRKFIKRVLFLQWKMILSCHVPCCLFK